MAIKKLIEVALPLEKINSESAREKSIRHGHPSTLHLWWARRPLAAARAVIWASLVDDPSSHPELFPTEEDQNKERQRLFRILENLVEWENSNDQEVLGQAKEEIRKYTGGNPPELLDPFAGGGAIPLEAQRLGLKAHAHDLNPVAVMINKAMIEIPPRFSGQAPVNPDSRKELSQGWSGAHGLAEDVRYYGEWMKQEAFKRIGHLYPKVKVPEAQGGGEATVIAWIWARTVKCPNPACGCEMPLVRSFTLSKKKGNTAWFSPEFDEQSLSFAVHHDGESEVEGTVSRKGAFCMKCGTPVDFPYIRNQGKQGEIKEVLAAVVAEGQNGRIYLSPDEVQVQSAIVSRPADFPDAALPCNPRDFKTPNYGLNSFSDLFTPRQLTALTTFSDLVAEAQQKAEQDARDAGLPDDRTPLAEGGRGALAYGQAVGVYLSLAVDKLTNYSCSLCTWLNQPKNEIVGNAFGRQALPMVWDYAEANPFSNGGGTLTQQLEYVSKVIKMCFPVIDTSGIAEQNDAQSECDLQNIMVSTDPPYYDNIGYADLSDFFYVWMRRSLKDTYPELFRTMLVPKTEELIATPYRHGGSTEKAKSFFEDGMLETCRRLYQYTREDIPLTVYYAYRQSDADGGEGHASTGWETMLSAIIKAGFAITGTWPMRTERAGRMVSNGANALASSIVLVCRKRPADALACTRRNFINELKRELRPALQKLQSSSIAPVDLAQSAIGPGMAVFSKYSAVLEADGTPMTVRTALKIINQELDLYFNEQDSDLDSESRFCVDLYSQIAFNTMKFGDANTLANAKNASIKSMETRGILYAQKGTVRLLERTELPEAVCRDGSVLWLLCQQLTHRMENEGIEGCAKAVAALHNQADADRAKDLAYRLFTIAERKNWNDEARAYNYFVSEWPKVQSRAAELRAFAPEQINLFQS